MHRRVIIRADLRPVVGVDPGVVRGEHRGDVAPDAVLVGDAVVAHRLLVEQRDLRRRGEGEPLLQQPRRGPRVLPVGVLRGEVGYCEGDTPELLPD